MSGNDIYCFMLSGAGLSDSIREFLFMQAQKMFHDKKKRQKIVHDDMEGLITTTGEVVNFGSISGYGFHAEIETEQSRSKVGFIVRPCDLPVPEGVWSEVDF